MIGNNQIEILKAFHPDIDDILKIINRFECRFHPNQKITVRHLHDQHQSDTKNWILMTA